MIIKDKDLLSTSCQEIYDLEEAKQIIKLLEKELGSNGIGLAANQIGINKRVCIIRIPNKSPIDLVNPTIKEESFPFVFNSEGCLSFPDLLLQTKRYRKIKVVDNFVPTGRYLYDLDAVCAQHEIDHLNGITFHHRQVNEA